MTDGVVTSTATLFEAVAVADGQLEGPVAATVTVAGDSARDAAHGDRYVLLSIASAHYAVLEAFVTELERIPKITPVPNVPAWVRGVTNLRGDILSVIDMRAFLGLEMTSSHAARMLVVRLPGEEFLAGLLVDGVDRIVAVPRHAITPPESSLEGTLAVYLSGVCVIDERLVAVLDLDRLLRSSIIRQFEELKEQPSEAEAAGLGLTTTERDSAEGRSEADKD
jgi:purine-binding chemotaxis protein CheW